MFVLDRVALLNVSYHSLLLTEQARWFIDGFTRDFIGLSGRQIYACIVWEKRGTQKLELVHADTWKSSTRYWDYLKDYWPSAGGLSAVNAIGTQLCDPINLGLTRWRLMVELDAVAENRRNPVSKHQIQPRCEE